MSANLSTNTSTSMYRMADMPLDNVISAQEIKRRGISAVDGALRHGPVHVIRSNRPMYVILSEEDSERLVGHRAAVRKLWTQLLEGGPPGGCSGRELLEDLGPSVRPGSGGDSVPGRERDHLAARGRSCVAACFAGCVAVLRRSGG
jgi:hypothetical protein